MHLGKYKSTFQFFVCLLFIVIICLSSVNVFVLLLLQNIRYSCALCLFVAQGIHILVSNTSTFPFYISIFIRFKVSSVRTKFIVFIALIMEIKIFRNFVNKLKGWPHPKQSFLKRNNLPQYFSD